MTRNLDIANRSRMCII